jgi:hypothetical protein
MNPSGDGIEVDRREDEVDADDGEGDSSDDGEGDNSDDGEGDAPEVYIYIYEVS